MRRTRRIQLRKILLSWFRVLAVMLFAASAQAQPRFAFDATPGSLTKDVVPSEYRLALNLDPAKATFSGVVDIALKVRRDVDAIVLNAFDLTAGEIMLGGAGTARAMTATSDTAKRQWRINDGRGIAPGEYNLRIAYSGVVNTYGEGLFGVAYSAEGKPARMLATQMEPIAARRVFPGFDEPVFRARFDIQVTAPSAFDVVSNMPVQTRDAQGDTTLWRFAATPPMPSYLVTVAVGQFDALEGAVDGVPLRILTAKGKREEARYAMAVTKQILPYYREYFGIPYALPKLDQLAVPGVRGGAMEDWGNISYNESNLLYDPAKSSIETKQGVYAVIAHEVAHQWFGDLVTAASWDEIWLNEAFAVWMQHKATARFNPDWQIPLHDILGRQWVMRGDAGPATRAIRSGPVIETAVFDVFDGVTYTKGGAVLEMLEAHIGPDAFRRGIAAYFEGQKFSNATAGDLWHYLGQASGTDVAAIAQSWTDQPGYPLLQARVACTAARQSLMLEQRRFSTDGAADAASLWKIPVTAATGNGTPGRFLLAGRDGKFDTGPCAKAPLYVDSSRGFFRVEYPPEHLRRLASSFPDLSPSVRLALLTDTYALGQAGSLSLTEYFALARHLKPAKDPATMVLFLQAEYALWGLDSALAGSRIQPDLRKYARGKLGPMLNQLGWNVAPGDTAVALNLRNELIDALGRFGDEATLRKSAQLFATERRGGPEIAPSIRHAVMANVGRRADAEIYAELLRRLIAADRVEDRHLYAAAIAKVENPELARRVLALSLADTLPPEIAASLPRRVADSPAHGEMAYAFTRDNFAALARKESEWGRAYLLPGAAGGFNDDAHAKALLLDQKRLLGDAGDKAGREMAAAIELRSRIKNREGAALAASLALGK
jgi:aminopeptidase N